MSPFVSNDYDPTSHAGGSNIPPQIGRD
jgi:hypothetical protein